MVVVCVGVRNFWLFFIVFVSISYFKLVILRRAAMGCILLNISLKLLLMLNIYVTVFFLFPLYLAALRCMLPKMGLGLSRLGLQ